MAHSLQKQEITVVNTFVHFKEDMSAVEDLNALRRAKTAPVNPDILGEESDEVGAEVAEKEEEKQEESSPSSSEASEPNDGSPVVSVMNTFLHVFSKERSFHRSKTAPERELVDEEDEELEDESEEEIVQPQLSRDVTADPFESPWNSTPERHQMPVPPNSSMTMPQAPVIFLAHALPAIAPMVPRPAAVQVSQMAPTPAPCLLGRVFPADEGLKKELMPGALRCEMVNGRELVRWNVDARKLDSHDTKVLSPQFDLEVPGQGRQPFRLMVLATQTSGKGGASFQKAAGRGRMTLKCESSLADARGMAFTVTLSSTPRAQHGPIWHNFSEQSCCSMQDSDTDWNFKAAVDRSRRSFQISMQVMDHA